MRQARVAKLDGSIVTRGESPEASSCIWRSADATVLRNVGRSDGTRRRRFSAGGRLRCKLLNVVMRSGIPPSLAARSVPPARHPAAGRDFITRRRAEGLIRVTYWRSTGGGVAFGTVSDPGSVE